MAEGLWELIGPLAVGWKGENWRASGLAYMIDNDGTWCLLVINLNDFLLASKIGEGRLGLDELFNAVSIDESLSL